MRREITMRLNGLMVALVLCAPLPTMSQDSYTIDELLRRADANNPRIAAARAGVMEAQGRHDQEGRYPNPFVEFMHDDVPTDSGSVSDGKSTVTLGQPIIIGGRRGHAVRAAEAGIEAAKWDYEEVRHLVFEELHNVWFEIAYLSDAMQIESDLVTRAKEIARLAKRETEVKRATVMAETFLAGILGLSTQQAIAVDRLQELLGGERLEANRLRGELESALDPTEVARLQSRSLAEHPRLLASEARVRQAEGDLRTARARVTPDITVSVLGGYAGRDDEGFAGAGVMIPIPLLNRLQGARAEAKAAFERREAEREQNAVGLQAELRIMLQLLNELDTLVETYGRSIVPMAQEAHAATLEDFREGRATVTDVLATLRDLAAAQRSELEFRLELSKTLSRYRHFVRYGPTSSVELPTEETKSSAR